MRIAIFLLGVCLILASPVALGQINSSTGACCNDLTDDCTDGLTVAACEQLCPGDQSRTWAVAENAVCRQFDNDQTNCEAAFTTTGGSSRDSVSCWYDATGVGPNGSGACNECAPGSERQGFCINDCYPAVCADPALTLAIGASQVCGQFALNQTACEAAYHLDTNGNPASCWYDAGSGGDCKGCGPNNESDGSCINACDPDPPDCEGDPSLTLAVGGNNVCGQFDGNQAACEGAYHVAGVFSNEYEASCWYDATNVSGRGTDVCLGCGPTNENQGFCVNSCGTPPAPLCDGDLTRSLVTGAAACRVFDGDPSSCDAAFAFRAGGTFGDAVSCWYDTAGIGPNGPGTCNGCADQNMQVGYCYNECDGNDTKWSAGQSCAAVACGVPQVPGTSSGGVAVLTLLLLAIVAFMMRYRSGLRAGI